MTKYLIWNNKIHKREYIYLNNEEGEEIFSELKSQIFIEEVIYMGL